MFKTLRKYHLIMIIWLIIQIVISLIYFVINYEYYNDDEFFSVAIVLFLLIGNFTAICFYIYLYSKWIRKRYITTAEIIKLNSAQALTFGNVGMIVLDSDLVIMWASEFLEEKSLENLIGKPVAKLSKDLQLLINNKISQVTLKINDMLFDAVYLAQTRTILLQETTKYHYLYSRLQKEKLVLGVISVDNYFNSLQKLRVENQIRVEAFIKTELNNFADTYSTLLLGNIEDGYTVMLYQDEFEKVRNDNFSLIKNVREGVKKFKSEITLSAGFSFGNGIIRDLHELAVEAKELATYRGGDQVVIREFGGNTTFIGGTIEAKQSDSKINIRMFANSLYNEIKLADNILVMGHRNADFDSISSGVAIIEIAKSLKKQVNYIVNQDEVDSKTLEVLKEIVHQSYLDNYFITGKQALKLINQNTLLIIVDTHKPERVDSPEVLARAAKIIVIDHHRVSQSVINNTVISYIDAGTSSTAESLSEVIYYNDFTSIENNFLWDLMLAGILIDTNNFQFRTTRRTFEACAMLCELGGSIAKVKTLLRDNLEQVLEKFKLISDAKEIKKGIFVTVANENNKHYIAYLAQISEMLLEIKECKASFTIGYDFDRRACVSARSNGEINVQIITEMLGGGGHFSAAAAQDSNISIEELYDKLVNAIENGDEENESNSSERS